MGRETQSSQAGEKRLERYGVWVKVEPREVAETPQASDSFELTDLETPKGAARSPSAEGTLTVEEEKLLDELDTELGPSDSRADLSIPEEEPLLAAEEDLPEISGASAAPSHVASEDEDLPELELEDEEPSPASSGRVVAAEAGEVDVPLSESTSQDRFEDLEALEDELASSTTSAASTPQGGSSEILSRIEEELRSIRADLTQLRSELTGLRKAGAEPAPESPRAAAEAQGGFFDEDEDETIALTGDELDNILNTAEITEEAAEAANVEEPEVGLEALDAAEESKGDVLSLDTPLAEEEIGAAESAEEVEELPSELELEDLSAEQPAKAETGKAEALPELDLEGIPEIETTEPAATEALELEEAPTEGEAVSGPASDLELVEEPAAEVKGEAAEELGSDVDLEALAAEAEALEGADKGAPVEDLELAELEAVGEESPAPAAPGEEIEIEFEGSGKGAPQPGAEEALLEPLEEVPEAEELPLEPEGAEAPEVVPVSAAAPRTGAEGIPEDLKDEIRTVLKYMDHLLEALPDEKIQEFASSDYFVMYKKLFEDLGLGE